MGENESNSALTILFSPGTVKREKEKANVTMSLLYHTM